MLKDIKLRTLKNTLIRGKCDLSHFSESQIINLSGSWMDPPGKLCKKGSSTVAYICGGVFVKCSPARKSTKALRRIFQTPRSKRSMIMAEKLNQLGIATPQVFCAVRETKYLLPVCDYLATSVLDENVTFCDKLPRREWENAFQCITSLLGNIHSADIVHGDASMRNFYLFRNGSENLTGTIDLDGCRRVPFFLRKKLFSRDNARFISSFIICSGEQETPENIRNLCSRFIGLYRNINSKHKIDPVRLEKDTLRFLQSTRR